MPSRRNVAELSVELSPLAREEFLHEVRYYAARGQAARFIAAVVEALERVRDTPHAFPQVGRIPSVRRVLTKRFPFAVIFMVSAHEPPLVIAFAHGARRPGYWRRRMRRS